MSGGPRGTPPPLDLRAVEARLRAFDAMAHGAAIPFSQETRALLAHTRALRDRDTDTENGKLTEFAGHSKQSYPGVQWSEIGD